jgi:hypothetical protein
MKRSFLNKRHPKYLERKAKLKQRSAKGVEARGGRGVSVAPIGTTASGSNAAGQRLAP